MRVDLLKSVVFVAEAVVIVLAGAYVTAIILSATPILSPMLTPREIMSLANTVAIVVLGVGYGALIALTILLALGERP